MGAVNTTPAIDVAAAGSPPVTAALGAARLPLVSYSYPLARCNASWNCNRDFILITNCSRVRSPIATAGEPIGGCYDWESNAERSGAAAVLRRHPGPPKHGNPKSFEMASIVRWLFLAQLAADLQLAAVAFVDCDVRVYSDLAALYASHPLLPLADLAITGRNGAVSVWRRAALDSFAAFLRALVATCDTAALSDPWSVDMSIIGAWQSMQTDLFGQNQPDGPRGAFPCANGSVPLPYQQPPFRILNFDQLSNGGDRGGWPLRPRWPVPRAWRFGAGNVGAVCPSTPQHAGCPAQPAQSDLNCTEIDARTEAGYFRARMAPLPHPTKGEQLVKRLYRLPVDTLPASARERTPKQGHAFCTPFVSDGCATLVPYHMVHYTGRFKHYAGLATGLARSNCACLRSWTHWHEAARNVDRAVPISHLNASARTRRRPAWRRANESAGGGLLSSIGRFFG